MGALREYFRKDKAYAGLILGPEEVQDIFAHGRRLTPTILPSDATQTVLAGEQRYDERVVA